MQTSRFVSQLVNRTSLAALRIFQWDAHGLSTKVHELRKRLQLGKIDIRLIEEAKLIHKDQLPAFAGVSTIRQDRPLASRCRGRLTLVKEGQ